MVGGEERIILVQLNPVPISHNDGDIVDSSVDWRFRYFMWTLAGNSVGMSSDRTKTSTLASPLAGSAFVAAGAIPPAFGAGQSFIDDSQWPANLSPAVTFPAIDSNGSQGVALFWEGAAGTPRLGFMLYVDATNGNLRIKHNSPTVSFVIWLRATAPYSNYGTV
jgi:hypothetical protein